MKKKLWIRFFVASVKYQHGFSTFLSVSKHHQRFYHFFACTKVYVEIAYIFKLFPFRGPDSARFKVFYILVASISSQFYLGQALFMLQFAILAELRGWPLKGQKLLKFSF